MAELTLLANPFFLIAMGSLSESEVSGSRYPFLRARALNLRSVLGRRFTYPLIGLLGLNAGSLDFEGGLRGACTSGGGVGDLGGGVVAANFLAVMPSTASKSEIF